MGIFGTALGQAQKLFDRGLALVGLLPCLVFSAVLLVLVYGGSSVSILTRNYGPKNEDGPILIFLTVVGLYLAAYILYGLRGLLYSLHCGGWSRLFGHVFGSRFLMRRLLTQQRALRRLTEAYETKAVPLQVVLWAGDPDLKYRPIYTPTALPLPQIHADLKHYERARGAVRKALADGQALSFGLEQRFFEMLDTASRLQSQLAHLKKDCGDAKVLQEREALIAGIERAVQSVKDDDAAFPAFAHCVADMGMVRFGERDLYFENLTAIFPHRRAGETAGRVRPTRLGNIALRTELYAQDRYGIALEELWPRLEMVMPDEIKKQVEDSRQMLDFAVIVTFLAGIAAVFQTAQLCGFAVRALRHGPHPSGLLRHGLHSHAPAAHLAAGMGGHVSPVSPVHFLAAFAGFAACILAVIAFDEVAVQAARGYGARLCSAVDLCRLDLLKSLSIPDPKTRAEETTLWERLSAFIREAEPLADIGYRLEPAEPRAAKRMKKPEDAGVEKSETAEAEPVKEGEEARQNAENA